MPSRFTRSLWALAVSFAATGAAQASTTLLDEGFDSYGSLAASGWLMNNLSSPVGSTGWYAGLTDVFAAQDGSGYLAANFNNAVAGGTIDNWLISPEFSTAQGGTVTFWVRGAADAGYVDQFKVGFSSGSANTVDFLTGPTMTASQDGWTALSFAFAGHGVGSTARFAIEYTGAADSADYIGVDRLTVSAVPEPATTLLFAAGLLGLAAARRRASR
jgi:hypothetical protein